MIRQQQFMYIIMAIIAQSFVIVLPVYTMHVYDSQKLTSYVTIIETLSGLIFGILMIKLSNFINNKIVLLIASLILSISMFFYQLNIDYQFNFLLYSIVTVVFIIFSRSISFIQYNFMFNTYSSIEDGLPSFNSFTNSVMQLSSLIIGPIAILMFQLFEYKYMVILTTLLFFCILVFIFKKNTLTTNNDKDVKKEIRVATKEILVNKVIMLPLILLAGYFFSTTIISSIYFLYLTEECNIGLNHYSFLITSQTLGSITCSLFVYKKIYKYQNFLFYIAFFLIIILYILLYVVSNNYLALMTIVFLIGNLNIYIIMTLNNMYQIKTNKVYFPKVNSIRVSLNNISGLLGSAFGSYLYIILSFRYNFFVCIILLIVIGFIALIKRREYTYEYK